MKGRWFQLNSDRLVVGLLVAESLLWLSNWLGWPRWHKGYAVLTSVAAFGVVLIVTLLWFVLALFFRRRFQFSVRSLLLAAVAVAVPCGWMSVAVREANQQKAAVDAIVSAAMKTMPIYWREYRDFQIDHLDRLMRYDYQESGSGSLPAARNGPLWLRTLLGDDFFNDVV